jgi:hypothetical protein
MQEKEQWYDETYSVNKLDYDRNFKDLFKPLEIVKKRI